MIPRFFLHQNDQISKDIITIREPEIIQQITRVLRREVGDEVILLDGQGSAYQCSLSHISATEVQAEIVKVIKAVEPKIKIQLYQALPKKRDKWELTLDYGTEVGITTFIPMITSRTESKWSDKHLQRGNKIVREAAEQSERGIIPTIHQPVSLQEAIKNPPKGINLIGDTYGGAESLKELLTTKLRGHLLINVFIGPEGGFSAEEIETAKKAGFLSYSLFPQILRTELAGVVSSGVILSSDE